MKILIATFTFLPNVNGVSQAANNMVCNFLDAGHEVFVATSHTINHEDLLYGDKIPSIHRFNVWGSPALNEGFHGDSQAYRDFIISLDPDIIIFHGWDTWPVEIALPLLPTLKAKTILLSHGQSSHLLNIAILPQGLVKWLRWFPHLILFPWRLRQFNKVVFLSKKTDLNRFFDAWIAHRTRCKNIAVIPNTVDTSGWENISDTFREDESINFGVFFLCVANYFPGKNQKMALDAFIQANISGSTLIFIGSELGEYGLQIQDSWEHLRQIYPNLSVRFYENMARVKVISAIRSCDIAILASKTEAQPITLLEAMACSKPFISTNVGCISELKGGIVVNNSKEMSEQMKHLGSDSDLRTRLGMEAKRDFESHYSKNVTCESWRNLIDSLEPQTI